MNRSRLPGWLDLISSQGEAIAIGHDGRNITYGELAARAGNLSSLLLRIGLSEGDLVEVSTNRHPDLVTALLASWDAGATVVVDDASEPWRRRSARRSMVSPFATILAAADAADHPSDRNFLITYAADGGFACVSASRKVGGKRRTAVDPRIAYLQFTSGTTGVPKLIAGSQEPVLSFIRWHVREFQFNTHTAFALLAGVGHDPVYRDILTPLLCGGRLEIPLAGVRSDPELLFDWLEASRVNIIHTTPLILDSLAAVGEDRMLSSLTHVFVGGDILTFGHVQRFRSIAGGGCRIFNVYGTTETPQIAAMHEILPGAETLRHPSEIVPVGSGINGAELGIRTKPLPDRTRARGEIVICSHNLALGNLDPDGGLTPLHVAEDDPLSYETGDIGELTSNDEIVCLGRADDCVTWGGERVQGNEIAAALGQHPCVRNCVIDIERSPEKPLALTAYCVLSELEKQGGHPTTAAGLRAFLRDWLPPVAIPDSFHFVAEIPLSGNGKADLKSLRAKVREPHETNECNEQMPQSQTEYAQRIAGIWKKFMKVETIDQWTDFFAIGGHSLQAARIVQAINKEFELAFPMDLLWASPTVYSIARLIESEKAKSILSSHDRSA